MHHIQSLVVTELTVFVTLQRALCNAIEPIRKFSLQNSCLVFILILILI